MLETGFWGFKNNGKKITRGRHIIIIHQTPNSWKENQTPNSWKERWYTNFQSTVRDLKRLLEPGFICFLNTLLKLAFKPD